MNEQIRLNNFHVCHVCSWVKCFDNTHTRLLYCTLIPFSLLNVVTYLKIKQRIFLHQQYLPVNRFPVRPVLFRFLFIFSEYLEACHLYILGALHTVLRVISFVSIARQGYLDNSLKLGSN